MLFYFNLVVFLFVSKNDVVVVVDGGDDMIPDPYI